MLEYKFDTQLLLEGEGLSEDEINDFITENLEGDSLLAVGDERLIKLHFHTNSPWELLEYCAANNIGVIAYSPMASGLLTGKYQRGMEPPKGSRAEEKPAWLASPDEALYDRLEAIEAGAKSRGIPMSAYALRWTLEQPAVVSAIVGVKNRRQVDDAIAAIG